jgi:hypothetical protein
MGLYLVDERNNFQPAGIAPYGRSKGGHLDDDFSGGRIGTIQAIEMSLAEATAVEQGMVLQNIALMAQAIGLGGFPNFARHEYGWFQALGFRMGTLPASRYLGAPWWMATALRLLGRDQAIPYPLGLERDGQVLLKPNCPPDYPSMKEAVAAFVERKFGSQGVFRRGAVHSNWRNATGAAQEIPAPSEAAVAATVAYCDYVYGRYGRFPAYSPPYRTVLGYQATHVDVEFYDRFFHPAALTATQRQAWAHRVKGLA